MIELVLFFQRESTRLLGWLKTLKETHGSVEQSSLSLASAINAHGVYHVGWSDERTEKVRKRSGEDAGVCGVFAHCLHLFPDVSTKHGSTNGEKRQKSEEIQA